MFLDSWMFMASGRRISCESGACSWYWWYWLGHPWRRDTEHVSRGVVAGLGLLIVFLVLRGQAHFWPLAWNELIWGRPLDCGNNHLPPLLFHNCVCIYTVKKIWIFIQNNSLTRYHSSVNVLYFIKNDTGIKFCSSESVFHIYLCNLIQLYIVR